VIAHESGNQLVAEALEHLHVHVHIFRSYYISGEITKEAAAEHADIFKALRSRDGVAAENAMRRHIQRTHKRLSSLVPK
jgi:DNA-binding GntR family transcriptional regulator